MMPSGNAFAIVDAEDAERCSKYSWSVHDGYAYGSVNRQTTSMHRFILGYTPGDRPDLHVDHINHNRLDNRRCNLRIATPEENQRNKIGRTGEKMQGVRVCFTHYVAEIVHEGRRVCIGRYDSAEAAARGYLHHSIGHHGRSAVIHRRRLLVR